MSRHIALLNASAFVLVAAASLVRARSRISAKSWRTLSTGAANLETARKKSGLYTRTGDTGLSSVSFVKYGTF